MCVCYTPFLAVQNATGNATISLGGTFILGNGTAQEVYDWLNYNNDPRGPDVQLDLCSINSGTFCDNTQFYSVPYTIPNPTPSPRLGARVLLGAAPTRMLLAPAADSSGTLGVMNDMIFAADVEGTAGSSNGLTA